MFTSLIVAVSIWGTDPEVVFSDPRAAWPTPQVAPVISAKSSQSAPSDNDMAGRFIRGQTVSDETDDSPTIPGIAGICENPFVKEFIRGMNPFVPEELHLVPNYYDPFGFQMGTSSTGRQGYRLGWVSYNDITVIPYASAHGVSGSMKVVEWNSNTKYSHLIAPGVLFNGTGYFNARWWDGPSGIALPAQVDQISADLELGLFNDGPWSGQIAFHPQIVETYEGRLDWNAFNFDGRVVTTYEWSPELSFVAGVAFWDRVGVLVVPHVGVVWTPDDRWEFRILFPRSRISYFVGNWWNADFWIYGTAEYTAESYQASIAQLDSSDRIQLTDDRLALGLRWDTGRYSFFAEGGFVFDRKIKFAGSNPSFNLSDSGMIRVGVRY